MNNEEPIVHNIPLVFHHAGTSIPRWALTTLKFSAQSWDGPIYVLLDHPHQLPQGVAPVVISNWYDPDPFQEFATRFGRPIDFREGFWFHAVERFFVLSQWSRHFNEPIFLHTELDVRLMAPRLLCDSLPKDQTGVHYPRASQFNAGANVLFVNGENALDPLLEFFLKSDGELFEMEILARFLDEELGNGFALPSHYSLEHDEFLRPKEMTPLFDVHPIGTWILGFDPRNSKNAPVFNHYYFEGMGSELLSQLMYSFSFRKQYLQVHHRELGTFPVVALHVHSKLMLRAHLDPVLALYTLFANFPWKTLIVGQHWGKFIQTRVQEFVDRLYLFGRRRFYRLIGSARQRR